MKVKQTGRKPLRRDDLKGVFEFVVAYCHTLVPHTNSAYGVGGLRGRAAPPSIPTRTDIHLLCTRGSKGGPDPVLSQVICLCLVTYELASRTKTSKVEKLDFVRYKNGSDLVRRVGKHFQEGVGKHFQGGSRASAKGMADHPGNKEGRRGNRKPASKGGLLQTLSVSKNYGFRKCLNLSKFLKKKG